MAILVHIDDIYRRTGRQPQVALHDERPGAPNVRSSHSPGRFNGHAHIPRKPGPTRPPDGRAPGERVPALLGEGHLQELGQGWSVRAGVEVPGALGHGTDRLYPRRPLPRPPRRVPRLCRLRRELPIERAHLLGDLPTHLLRGAADDRPPYGSPSAPLNSSPRYSPSRSAMAWPRTAPDHPGHAYLYAHPIVLGRPARRSCTGPWRHRPHG